MANASPRDTRAGYDLFLQSGGEIALADLNVQLSEAGYGPIAARTFKHYRKLTEAGYNRYISINRFDVARAAIPFEGNSSNARYFYLPADLGVRVMFAKASRLFEASGRATAVGEVGAMVRFLDPEVVSGLRQLRPQPGDMATLRYLEPGRTVAGRVVDADINGDPAVIEIEYTKLLAISNLEAGSSLPISEYRFILTGPDATDTSLDVAGRRLYSFFELIEGIRSLCNHAGAQQGEPVYAAPAVLQRLSVASPIDLVIQVAHAVHGLMPWGIGGGVLKAAAAFPEKRKQWYEGSSVKRENHAKDLELDLKRLEVERAQQEALLRNEVLERVRKTFPDSQLGDETARRYIDSFILEPLRALGSGGIEALVHPDQQPPNPSQQGGEGAVA